MWSVEWWPDLAAHARANVEAAGISCADVVAGDGTQGLPAHAPFRGIVVSAAFPTVPPPLVEQLAAAGRLVQPLGAGGNEEVVLFEKADGSLHRLRRLLPARFVRLVGAHGIPSNR